MKPGIHPTWYPDAVVTCACGNTWTTGSTKKEIHTDVCNKCHPFFTGEQRIVDTAGQVERFMKRINAKEQIAATQPAPEDKKAKKEKRRERKAGTTVSLQPPPAAPEELPLAVAVDRVVAQPAPEAPISHIEPIKFAEPALVEEPKPVAKVEEPAPVEAKVEQVTPLMQAEELAPVAAVEEPVAVVEVPAPVAQIEETTSVAVVEEVTPGVERQAIAADDLTIIEGIGPKIASVLKGAGVTTLGELAHTDVAKLNEVLKNAGLNLADPGTWAEQARLAVEGKTEELQKLQDELSGGRRVAKKPAAKKATPAKPRVSRTKKEDN